jgi:hypothetical protein
VLVAMNPAALKTNVGDLPQGGTLIVDGGRTRVVADCRPFRRRLGRVAAAPRPTHAQAVPTRARRRSWPLWPRDRSVR